MLLQPKYFIFGHQIKMELSKNISCLCKKDLTLQDYPCPIGHKKHIKGAEANLYTFREQSVFEGIQICFHTLYIQKLFHTLYTVQGENTQQDIILQLHPGTASLVENLEITHRNIYHYGHQFIVFHDILVYLYNYFRKELLEP